MKKFLLLISGLLVLLSFTSDPNTEIESPPAITLCATNTSGNLPVSTVAFIPSRVLATHVRKDVCKLTLAEINSIKAGVAAMKSLPFDDPTSWTYQAAIHGTTRSENLPSWNTCHVQGDDYFFLAWHRMYVYFFERILRAKSGSPTLTLPYWDYTRYEYIPPVYRDSAATNPLYDGTRSSTLNSGGSLALLGIETSINSALDQLAYYDFQSDINSPHGAIHIAIGGNMQLVQTAAQDPVFWLHHANIDRIWEQWLRKCKGRANPVDQQWLNKSYTFFDETGTAITLSGSQVVKTATQLSYVYDFPVREIDPCIITDLEVFVYESWRCLRWPDPEPITGGRVNVNVKKDLGPMALFLQETNRKSVNFMDNDKPDKLILEFEKIEIDKFPDGVVEVYLNLPANEKPTPRSRSFVGMLDLFSAGHHHNMDHGKDPKPLSLNATTTARALKLQLSDLQKVELSFFVRGNYLQGKEVKTASQIRISTINLAVEIAKK